VSNFKLKSLPIEGLILVKRNEIGDSRGFLSRIFCKDDLYKAGWKEPIYQINHTLTAKKGTVRGMHFQYPPFSEKKLVSCIKGKILDIAVDLRSGSSSFLKWHAEVLSQDNLSSLLIPAGFAHGFQALEDKSELIYLHSQKYEPSSEDGLRYNDPTLNIEWPLEISDCSVRDRNYPLLTADFIGVKAQ
jgi:dTDP-4-dehydrorhamnose 3,5-epimerase